MARPRAVQALVQGDLAQLARSQRAAAAFKGLAAAPPPGLSSEATERLERAAAGVQRLAAAYRRTISQQCRLIRHGDLVQGQLRCARDDLARQADRLADANAQLRAEMGRRRDLENELRRRARTDLLTGAARWRQFLAFAQHERDRQRRRGDALALVVAELDGFTALNRRYGRAAGDQVLVAVAERLGGCLRWGDVLGRTGACEFAVLLPETDMATARRRAAVLRDRVARDRLRVGPGVAVQVTLSAAVAAVTPAGPAIAATLDQARAGLVGAQAAGGNRVAEPATGAEPKTDAVASVAPTAR